LLAPTILTFALINPLAWLMLASGHAARSLKIALLIAPVVILSYVVGLRFGPHGVAAGFSIAMVILAVPVIAWAKHGTNITASDMLRVVLVPLVSVIVGAGAALGMRGPMIRLEPVFIRLVVESGVLFGVYLFMLLFVMRQMPVYTELLRETGLWRVGGGRNKTEAT
jgi:hypothetical protein